MSRFKSGNFDGTVGDFCGDSGIKSSVSVLVLAGVMVEFSLRSPQMVVVPLVAVCVLRVSTEERSSAVKYASWSSVSVWLEDTSVKSVSLHSEPLPTSQAFVGST